MYEPILSKNDVTKWIDVCAWCDESKIITKNYIENGWKASHGICIQHKDEVLKEYHEKQSLYNRHNDVGDDVFDIMWYDSGSGI